MNSKSKALTLLAVVALAAVVSSLIVNLQSSSAQTDNALSSNAETAVSAVAPLNASFALPERGVTGHRCQSMMGHGMQQIQISEEYTANITSIAKSDSDVAALIAQGYNITAIHPKISTTIDGNGNVATKAGTAEVTLIGLNGRAQVTVDLEQAKVTKIVTVTVTEINK